MTVKSLSRFSVRMRSAAQAAGACGSGILLILSLGSLGCAPALPNSGTGAIHEIVIQSSTIPTDLIAQRGEEVRWHNRSPKVIAVGLLDFTWDNAVTCEKGFRRFGRLDDFVTILPGHYASLCFSRTRPVSYNVWRDADDLRGSMMRTATIHIRESSGTTE